MPALTYQVQAVKTDGRHRTSILNAIVNATTTGMTLESRSVNFKRGDSIVLNVKNSVIAFMAERNLTATWTPTAGSASTFKVKGLLSLQSTGTLQLVYDPLDPINLAFDVAVILT
jgi:hypothetical protein